MSARGPEQSAARVPLSGSARSAGRSHTLITGGAGFLGCHLARRLLSEGGRVTCLDNLTTGRLDNVADLLPRADFRLIVADATQDFPDLEEPVDLVLHLASPAAPRDYLSDPFGTLEAGSVGTRNVLEFSARAGARVVVASTSEVYGDPQVHPQPESYWGHVNPIGPRSVYDESKRFAEALTTTFARERGVDAAIVRIFNVFGPRMRTDDSRLVPTLIGQALRGEPLTVHGDGRQTRSLCYVDDLVEGMLAVGRSRLAGPVNLGNADEKTVLGIAGLIDRLAAEVQGRSPGGALVHLPPMQDEPRRRCPDLSLAAQELGWYPTTTVEDGLKSTVVWCAAATRGP